MKQYVYALVASILGIFITFGIVKYTGLGSSESKGPKVIVSKAEISPGTIIGDLQVEQILWAGKQAPEASFSDKKEVINRIARDKIYPGEAIVEGKLAPVGSKAGMEAMISVGKRAITVRVNDIVGVAGFALPGSYVDILANIHDASNQPYSKVVLNRVKVLAVAQDTATDPSKPKVVNAVTLELTPAEAEKLDLVRTIGSLSLVLRNEMDNTTNTSSGARVNDLMSNHETSEAVKLDNIPSRINQLDDGRGDLKGKIANKPVNPIPSEGYGRVEEIRGLNRSKTQDSPN